jgi:hypothetical protein
MKRFFKSMGKKWVVVAAIVAMVTATAVSYAFWRGDILNPAVQNQDFNVVVGEADDIETAVVLDDFQAATSSGVATGLVPASVRMGTQIDSVRFTIGVAWNATSLNDAFASQLDDVPGTLVVTLLGVYTAADFAANSANPASLTNLLSNGDFRGRTAMAPAGNATELFNIDYRTGTVAADGTHTTGNRLTGTPSNHTTSYGVSSNIAILGNNTSPVVVGVNVSMNLPYDENAYDLVAGHSFVLRFGFTVTVNP